MTEEPPDTSVEKDISSDALDWSTQFKTHFSIAFQEECGVLPANASQSDFQQAAAKAMISTLRDSGMKEADLISCIGSGIWGDSEASEEWSDTKNARRIELIDKLFQESITIEERFELNSLTRLMRMAVDTEENLPTHGAKKLYNELLELGDDE